MAELKAETLAGIRLFRHLPADERKALVDRCQTHRYAAKQQILSHAAQSSDVYFIVSGQVRATIYSTGGKEVAFRDLGAGEMFGDLSAIDGKARSASIVALTDSFVISMTAKVFQEVLLTHPALAMAALREVIELVRGLCERVIEMSTLGVKNRIHAELLRLAQKKVKDGRTAVISPAPTHADIASRVSTQREAVTREINRLAQMGVIKRNSDGLVIEDVVQLAQMVEEVRHRTVVSG